MFISKTFNKLFNLQENQLGWELTLMELYEKTHIENRDTEKIEKKFVDKKIKVFIVSVLIVIIGLKC